MIIGKMEQGMNLMLENMTREFDLWAQRSDKRYQRAMKEAEELHKHNDRQDVQILELYKELYYLKGKEDAKD